MAAQITDEFSQQHLAAFLDKIDADRRQRLRELKEQTARELEAIRRDAYDQARAFHRAQATRVREAQQQEQERQLSRARADIRRRRWLLLQDLLEDAMWAAGQAMHQRWLQPEHQQNWCRYWLRVALEHSDGAALTVTIGEGGVETTRTALEQMLPAGGGHSVRLAATAPAGITVEWGDSMLDGRLESQYPRLEELLFAELTAWLHEQDNGKDAEP